MYKRGNQIGTHNLKCFPFPSREIVQMKPLSISCIRDLNYPEFPLLSHFDSFCEDECCNRNILLCVCVSVPHLPLLVT